MQEAMAAPALALKVSFLNEFFLKARLSPCKNDDIFIAILQANPYEHHLQDIFQQVGKEEDKNVKVQKLRQPDTFLQR